MDKVFENLLAEASSIEEYETLLDMFGETDAPEWGDKTRKREERRGHFAGRLIKAESVIKAWGWGSVEAKKKAPLFADNLKKCSCWMCRSPRTLYRGKNSMCLTKQELESITTYKQQLKELTQGE